MAPWTEGESAVEAAASIFSLFRDLPSDFNADIVVEAHPQDPDLLELLAVSRRCEHRSLAFYHRTPSCLPLFALNLKRDHAQPYNICSLRPLDLWTEQPS